MTPDAGYIKFVPGAVSLSKALAQSNGDLMAWFSAYRPEHMSKDEVPEHLKPLPKPRTSLHCNHCNSCIFAVLDIMSPQDVLESTTLAYDESASNGHNGPLRCIKSRSFNPKPFKFNMDPVTAQRC